jgi:hypothetical protein
MERIRGFVQRIMRKPGETTSQETSKSEAAKLQEFSRTLRPLKPNLFSKTMKWVSELPEEK